MYSLVFAFCLYGVQPCAPVVAVEPFPNYTVCKVHAIQKAAEWSDQLYAMGLRGNILFECGLITES